MKVMPGDDDRRYRISVFLQASHQPRYWKFHCVYCGNKVCELSGDVLYMSDTDDVHNYQERSAPVIVPCKGRIGNEWCRMWYEIVS